MRSFTMGGGFGQQAGSGAALWVPCAVGVWKGRKCIDGHGWWGFGLQTALGAAQAGFSCTEEIYIIKVGISIAFAAERLACSPKEHCVCKCSPQVVRMELGCVWLLQLQASPFVNRCICKTYRHSYTLSTCESIHSRTCVLAA